MSNNFALKLEKSDVKCDFEMNGIGMKPPAPILEATDKRRYVTDSFNLLQILSAYQQILHHSSRNVADNQDRLITKIEPTEAEVQRNMQHIQKTGNELSSLESQLKTIQSMANAVQLAQDQLVHIISFLDQIEALIPPEFTKPDTPLKISRQTHPS